MAWRGRILWTAVMIGLALGCQRQPAGTRYPVSGQILAVHPERNELLMRHEEIPGFMPAMTMPFSVKDSKLFEGRQPGERIRAVLVVTETSAWLEAIERTGLEPLPVEKELVASAELEVGQEVADLRLVDQHGKARRLEEWRGRALVVTFIFTRCPLPEFCPAMNRRFSELAALIAADPVLRQQARLLTISFDPDFDKPEVLSTLARRLQADPELWTFATGERADIDRFGSDFGLVVERGDGTPQSITHNLRTAILDSQGRLVEVLRGTDWPAAQAANSLRRLGGRP